MTYEGQNPMVVDTNVVSYIYRNENRAQPYLNHLTGHRAVISFQTYEELLFGALISNWGQQSVDELLEYVSTAYDIINYDLELVRISARLRADSRRSGRELKSPDGWIAATAILLNCTLLAHDGDFDCIPGLKLIRYRDDGRVAVRRP
ncbi:MAG: PIN domain-containing protein [Chloroflexota bacterium]|nr:PIN domain-containing protein [Chloroflexota bacterium]MDE2960656.1 PIN domain-containing protein [Chloroflexota bacterium]